MPSGASYLVSSWRKNNQFPHFSQTAPLHEITNTAQKWLRGIRRDGSGTRRLGQTGVALVKVGGKASLPRRSFRLRPSLEYLIRTQKGDTDSSGNSRPERLGAAYLYSTSSAGLPPRPKNRRWQVDASSATRGPEDYPFSFCSILLRVSKNLPVATAGPMRRRPKVFQPNICHQEV